MPHRALNIPRVYKRSSFIAFRPTSTETRGAFMSAGFSLLLIPVNFLDRYRGTVMAVVVPINGAPDT